MLHVMRALTQSGRYESAVLLPADSEVASRFVELGYEVIVAPFPIFGAAGERPVTMREVVGCGFQAARAMVRLKQAIVAYGADGVYLNSGVLAMAALAAYRLKLPVFWHVREVLDRQTLLGRSLTRLIGAISTRVFANSARSAAAVGRGCGVSIVYDCISDVFARSQAPARVEEVREGWGCESDDFVVVLVAPMTWKKGHEVALQAMRRVACVNRRVRLIFVGGSMMSGAHRQSWRFRLKRAVSRRTDPEEYLKRLTNKLGLEAAIRFDGWRTDEEVALRLHAADVVIFPPTIAEGFGRPAAEAALAARACIATNTGALPELVLDGLTGWLVPSGDAAALAERMLHAAACPEKLVCMGKRAKEIALERFSCVGHDAAILAAFDAAFGSERTGRVGKGSSPRATR